MYIHRVPGTHMYMDACMLYHAFAHISNIDQGLSGACDSIALILACIIAKAIIGHKNVPEF